MATTCRTPSSRRARTGCVSSSTSRSASTSCSPPSKSPSPRPGPISPHRYVPDPRLFRDPYMLTVLVAQLPSSLAAPLSLVLFAGACLGNLILFIALHNLFYASALPRPLSGAIRYSLGLASL